MTYIATRRRFGRNVFAIGGNPDAAELSGINIKRTIMYTFGLMGLLAGVSAVVQTARLNAAVTGLGVVERARRHLGRGHRRHLVRRWHRDDPGRRSSAPWSCSRSGRACSCCNVDSPIQDIVVGIVLVAAVGVDSFLRRRGHEEGTP